MAGTDQGDRIDELAAALLWVCDRAGLVREAVGWDANGVGKLAARSGQKTEVVAAQWPVLPGGPVPTTGQSIALLRAMRQLDTERRGVSLNGHGKQAAV